jgi:hypothetical protein
MPARSEQFNINCSGGKLRFSNARVVQVVSDNRWIGDEGGFGELNVMYKRHFYPCATSVQ